jgi:hypothetical protein
MRTSRKRSRKETAYIIHPQVTLSGYASGMQGRQLDDVLEEARGLALAIDLEILDIKDVRVSRIHSGFFLARGNAPILPQISKP